MTDAIIHAQGDHIEVRGHKLWVEQEGMGDPVLLLSGLGPAGSHLIFHPFFSELARTHRVIYVDLYGRGRSEHPQDLDEIAFEGDVEDIASLINALGLGPVHLYGFSYGGLIAQALALRVPKKVRTLTLANTLHSPEMWQRNHDNINRELANQFPDVWARIEASRRRGLFSTDPEMQKEFSVHARLVRFYNPDNANLLLSEPGSRNADLYPIFCGADVDFIIGGKVPNIPDFRSQLKNIQCPMLVLAGRYDRALYPAMQKEFANFAPSAKYMILERSGSFGHVEEPETVFRILRQFWNESDQAGNATPSA